MKDLERAEQPKFFLIAGERTRVICKGRLDECRANLWRVNSEQVGPYGVFKNLGEEWFDEYWMNYGKITIKTSTGKQKKLTKLTEFLEFKGKDPGLANPCVRTNRNNGGKQDA